MEPIYLSPEHVHRICGTYDSNGKSYLTSWIGDTRCAIVTGLPVGGDKFWGGWDRCKPLPPEVKVELMPKDGGLSFKDLIALANQKGGFLAIVFVDPEYA